MGKLVNVMLDLETLGTEPGCIVLSIGAVAWDYNAGKLGMGFHEIISAHDSKKKGLNISLDTLKWHLDLPPEGLETLRRALDKTLAVPLGVVLAQFGSYLLKVQIEEKADGVAVWGNGAGFDQPLLVAACKAAGMPEAPWKFYNDGCYRTLKNLRPDIKLPWAAGVKHNALDDAIYQAQHAIMLMREINGLGALPTAEFSPIGQTYIKNYRLATPKT